MASSGNTPEPEEKTGSVNSPDPEKNADQAGGDAQETASAAPAKPSLAGRLRSKTTGAGREGGTGGSSGKSGGKSGTRRLLDLVAGVRKLIGQAIWIFCVLAALSLAVGALLVALGDVAVSDNAVISFIMSTADAADLGWFDRDGQGLFDFSPGENVETKNALVNWGIGALAWLIVGKVAEKIVRP